MLKGITKETLYMSFVSFCMSLSSSIMTILPILFIMKFDMKFELIILVRSLGEISGYIGRVIVGLLSDIFKTRKQFLLIGYMPVLLLKLLATVIIFDIFTPNISVIVFSICNIIDKFLNVVRDVPRDTFISDYCAKEDLAKNLGLRKFFSLSGTVIGMSLYYFISVYYANLVTFFFIFSYLVACMGIIVLLTMIQDAPIVKQQEFELPQLVTTIKNVYFIVFLCSVLMLFGGKISELFIIKSFTEHNATMLNIIYYASSMIGSMAFGFIKFPKLFFYILILCAGLFNFYCLNNLILVYGILGSIIYGLVNGIMDNALINIVIERFVKPGLKGSLLGLLNVIIAIGCGIMAFSIKYYVNNITLISSSFLFSGLFLLLFKQKSTSNDTKVKI